MESIRTTLKIPAKVAAIIESVIQHRIDSGNVDDVPINRNGVAIEMMRIGANVLKKRIESNDEIQKAYAKEFEIIAALLVSCDYFSRLNATACSNIDFSKDKDNPHLQQVRDMAEAKAKELLA